MKHVPVESIVHIVMHCTHTTATDTTILALEEQTNAIITFPIIRRRKKKKKKKKEKRKKKKKKRKKEIPVMSMILQQQLPSVLQHLSIVIDRQLLCLFLTGMLYNIST
jgi:hypothetical protein